VPKLQEADDGPNLKNNVLPFPALYAVPKDPPRPSLLRGFLILLALGACLFLFGLTIWALLS
jgi:hypothetical protein